MRAWIHQSERSWQAYWSQGLFSLFYMSHTEWVMVENIERLTTQNWHDVKYSRKMSKNCEKLTKRNLPRNHLTKKQMWLITVQLLDVEKYSIDWKDFVIILKNVTVWVFRSFKKVHGLHWRPNWHRMKGIRSFTDFREWPYTLHFRAIYFRLWNGECSLNTLVTVPKNILFSWQLLIFLIFWESGAIHVAWFIHDVENGIIQKTSVSVRDSLTVCSGPIPDFREVLELLVRTVCESLLKISRINSE